MRTTPVLVNVVAVSAKTRGPGASHTSSRVLKKSVAWGRNREHNRIERSPERNRTAAEMGFSTAC
jgi:hypothetical protein